MSVADLALEGQRINTALLRGVLDNTYLQINGRYFAVDGQVNLDDLLTSRPGGVVRVKQPGAAGRLDQGAGDSQLGMGMLEYMRGFKEESTGWSRNAAGNDPGALSTPVTATQATIVTNRADMRLDLIARNFAEGFRDLFRLMLKHEAMPRVCVVAPLANRRNARQANRGRGAAMLVSRRLCHAAAELADRGEAATALRT